ncbi:hypothetical protein KY289_010773 [Solanum tuberosum]|nr:hypothetical protein KY289_010773 [Solanum tuberosum]
MFETLNVGSSYCIMVIAVNGTHLHGKYEGVLLSVVAQDMENHVYPIAFCVVDKENDASWTFFFEKLKEIVVDELDLCFISDKHKSIANSIVNVYNHAHHRYCMRHLGENICVNHHCGDYFYIYCNATKAYSLEEFNNHFVEFKNKCPATAVVLEYDIGFEKWRRTHFPGNRYDVMTTNIAESLNAMLMDEREYPMASIFNSIAKKFGKLFRERHAYILKSMGRLLVCGELNWEWQSIYRLQCREYDLIKIPCAHAMVDLRSKHGNEYGMSIYEYSSPLYKVVCHSPSLHPGRGWHSRTIIDPKRILGLAYLLSGRLKHKKYYSCNNLKKYKS